MEWKKSTKVYTGLTIYRCPNNIWKKCPLENCTHRKQAAFEAVNNLLHNSEWIFHLVALINIGSRHRFGLIEIWNKPVSSWEKFHGQMRKTEQFGLTRRAVKIQNQQLLTNSSMMIVGSRVDVYSINRIGAWHKMGEILRGESNKLHLMLLNVWN